MASAPAVLTESVLLRRRLQFLPANSLCFGDCLPAAGPATLSLRFGDCHLAARPARPHSIVIHRLANNSRHSVDTPVRSSENNRELLRLSRIQTEICINPVVTEIAVVVTSRL